jgi:hypothetical protein
LQRGVEVSDTFEVGEGAAVVCRHRSSLSCHEGILSAVSGGEQRRGSARPRQFGLSARQRLEFPLRRKAGRPEKPLPVQKLRTGGEAGQRGESGRIQLRDTLGEQLAVRLGAPQAARRVRVGQGRGIPTLFARRQNGAPSHLDDTLVE